MSKHNNNGDGSSKGFGSVDTAYTPPGQVAYPEPGPQKVNDSDWVRRDMLWKSTLPRVKYY